MEIPIDKMTKTDPLEEIQPGYPCTACTRRRNKESCKCDTWWAWFGNAYRKVIGVLSEVLCER